MINKLDNADVIMISGKGHYGYIKTLDSDDAGIEVCYLAVCKYPKDNVIYLFLCDKNMSTEQDVDFESVEEAVTDAQRRSQSQINWIYPD